MNMDPMWNGRGKEEGRIMGLQVQKIKGPWELEAAAAFRIGHLLWGTKEIPRTYGYLGYVPGKALYLELVCEEKDPLRRYQNDQEPVYRDSAVEAFFQFGGRKEAGEQIYLNFEMNANGALLAAYGKGRTDRVYFTEEECRKFACKARIEEERWSVSLCIPFVILENVYGPLKFGPGTFFRCNFYKISETKEIEHYASYALVDTDTPDFHRPEFFAEAQFCEV
ncbi:carbohydrate-binding family 9-like protein [Roseburia hominis]